jgi:hypothetical protein
LSSLLSGDAVSGFNLLLSVLLFLLECTGHCVLMESNGNYCKSALRGMRFKVCRKLVRPLVVQYYDHRLRSFSTKLAHTRGKKNEPRSS